MACGARPEGAWREFQAASAGIAASGSQRGMNGEKRRLTRVF